MTQSQPTAPRPETGAGSLRVGRFTKPHGLKGGLKLELFTDNPDLRFKPGSEFHLQVPEDSAWFGKTVTMKELRWFNDQPVGFFEDIPDRTAAESIVRAILWIGEETVDAGEEDNAWYDHQLVGMQVQRDGETLGTVSEVQHLPAHDLLAVTTDHGTVLVPFVKEIVPSVDAQTRVITVTPPEGLFEELAETATEPDQPDQPDQPEPSAAHEN